MSAVFERSSAASSSNGSQEPVFSLVNQPIHASKRTSSLYQYILSHQVFLQSLGHVIQSKFGEERAAFFFTLKPIASSERLFSLPVFANSTCKEHHLTVDKYYSSQNTLKGNQGFSYAHQTIVLHDNQTHVDYTIHVYFTEMGHYLNYQITPALEELKTNVLDNIMASVRREAETLLINLLKLKAERRSGLIEEAALLEHQLIQLSLDFSKLENRENYIHIAHQFLALINTLNLIEEQALDKRSELISKIISMLENHKEIPLPAQEEVPQLEEEQKAEPLAALTALEEESARKKVSFTNLFEKVLLLEQQFNALFNSQDKSTRNFIKLHQLVLEIKQELLEITLQTGLSPKSERKRTEIIKRLDTAISKVPDPGKLILKAADEGDIESFRLLYPFAKITLNFKFYHQFLLNICNEESSVSNKQKVELGNFLFNASEDYRLAMTILGRCVYSSQEVNFHCSPLLRACLHNNLPVFCMLLNHGYPTHLPGAVHGKWNIPIIKACLHLSASLDGNDRPEYIQALLDAGATLDLPCEESALSGIELGQSSKAKLKPLSRSAKKDPALMHEWMLESDQDLYHACRYRLYGSAARLIKKSSHISIALSLAWLSFLKGMNYTIIVPAYEGGVFRSDNSQETHLIRLNTELLIEQQGLQNKLSVIIYPDQSDNNVTLLELIGLLCQEFHTRSQDMMTGFKRDCERLEQKAKTLENFESATDYLRAILLLSAQKDALFPKDVENFSRVLCLIAKRYFQKNQKQMGHHLYELAGMVIVNLCNFNEQFRALLNTPIFGHVCKTLKGTAYEKNIEAKITAMKANPPAVGRELLFAYSNTDSAGSLRLDPAQLPSSREESSLQFNGLRLFISLLIKEGQVRSPKGIKN